MCLYSRQNLCWNILQAWHEVNEADFRLKAKSWTAKSFLEPRKDTIFHERMGWAARGTPGAPVWRRFLANPRTSGPADGLFTNSRFFYPCQSVLFVADFFFILRLDPSEYCFFLAQEMR